MKATTPITLPYFQRSRGWILLLLLLILPASLKAELLYSTFQNTITITGSNPQATGVLIIPTRINNLRVTSIGYAAFYGCSGLTSVTLPNSITSIGYATFSGCSGLTSVIIPNSVISIGNSAFRECTGLTSVTIPDSVTSIGNSAFYKCNGLTSVTIPDGVTSIGNSAFYKCTGLTSVTIPGGVTSIGEKAFSYCYLTSVRFMGNAPTVGPNVFSEAGNNVTVYYIAGKTGWGASFAGRPTALWAIPR